MLLRARRTVLRQWPVAATSGECRVEVGEMCDRDGSFLAFARTDVDRASGDKRKSLAARYGDRARYAILVAAAARQLVHDRLLLPEDAERYITEAKARQPF